MNENVQSSQTSGSKMVWIGTAVVILILAAGWIAFGTVPDGEVVPAADQAAGLDESAAGLEPAPLAGHPAPDFTLSTLDGQEVSLSDFRGRPVIVNFWATWCGPCRIEMPHLQAAYANHQAEGLVVLGVNLTARDTVEEIPAFRDEFGLTFPLILDESGDVAKSYKLFGQPASVFVDKDGIIHELFQGPVNEEYINARVDELLSS